MFLQAITHYSGALKSVPEGSVDEESLRRKIIGLHLKLSTPIGISDDVLACEGRAERALKGASSQGDFLAAAAEYKKALMLAPWLADGYYNLAVVYEKAGKLDEAIKNYRYYLLAAPGAGNINEVKKNIAGLEYEWEKNEGKALARQLEKSRDEAIAGAVAGRYEMEKLTATVSVDGHDVMVKTPRIIVSAQGRKIKAVKTCHPWLDNKRHVIYYFYENVPLFEAEVKSGRITGKINDITPGRSSSEPSIVSNTSNIDDFQIGDSGKSFTLRWKMSVNGQESEQVDKWNRI